MVKFTSITAIAVLAFAAGSNALAISTATGSRPQATEDAKSPVDPVALAANVVALQGMVFPKQSAAAPEPTKVTSALPSTTKAKPASKTRGVQTLKAFEDRPKPSKAPESKPSKAPESKPSKAADSKPSKAPESSTTKVADPEEVQGKTMVAEDWVEKYRHKVNMDFWEKQPSSAEE